MILDYLAPTPGWAAAVSVYGHLHSVAEPSVQCIPALLPNVHFRLAGEAVYRFADGRVRPAPRVALMGATGAAFTMEVSAGYEMVCLGFLPDGWRRVVGVPAGLLADEVVDAATVWPSAALDRLWHALGEARRFADRRARIESFLAARADERAVEDGREALVRRWLEQPGRLQLDVLAAELAVSARQLERLTLDLYGASPKALAMKYRALRAAGALAVRGEEALPAALADYADQSHLIRDFRRFVGCTPGRFLRERQAMAQATMRGRWAAGVRSPLALLS
jgi:AraC-like DNA-binding protein